MGSNDSTTWRPEPGEALEGEVGWLGEKPSKFGGTDTILLVIAEETVTDRSGGHLEKRKV